MTRATCEDGGNDNNDYNDEELLRRRRRSLAGGGRSRRSRRRRGGGRDGNATQDRVRSLRSDVVPHLHTQPRRPRNDRVHRVNVNVDVIGGGGIDTSGRSTTLLPLVIYSYEGNQFCRLVREGIKGKFLP